MSARSGRAAKERGGPPPAVPEPLPVAVPDAHTHLDITAQGVVPGGGGRPEAPRPRPEPDGPLVRRLVDDARAAGVTPLLQTGVDVASSVWSADCARLLPGVVAAVAVHPNEAEDADDDALAEIERLAGLSHVRAVGETGLDFYRTTATRGAQERSLRAHARIASAAGKALVVHDRDAHDAVLDVLDAEGYDGPLVFHCFSGDAAFARRCVERGAVLSVAGTVTFGSAEPLREALRLVPDDQLLVETDAPFLTPAPHRGSANTPALTALVLRRLAAERGQDVAALAAVIASTAVRLFGPDERLDHEWVEPVRSVAEVPPDGPRLQDEPPAGPGPQFR